MEQSVICRVSTRRRHLPEFKARVVDQCAQPGASVAAVALIHGLNANLVHRWRRQASQTDSAAPAVVPATPPPLTPLSGDVLTQPSKGAAMTRPAPVAGNLGNTSGKGAVTGAFIALAHPAVQTIGARIEPSPVEQTDSIHIDIQRTHTHVRIRWPTSAASDCALWLKDLLQDPQQGLRRDVPRRGTPR